jgi:hypothetical protein
VRHYRRNDDRKVRELKRRAAQGDLEAQDGLLIEYLRQGAIDYADAVGRAVVSRGPILGWVLSWEHPGYVQLTPPAPWDQGVLIASGPWYEREGTSFSPLSLEAPDGMIAGTMRDLFTPDTGDVVVDAINYRDQLAGAVMALSFAGAALLHHDGMDRDTAWDVLNEGIGGPA